MSFKDYDAMLAEKFGGPPSFKVGGRTWKCRAKLPWKKFTTMLLSLGSTSNEDIEQTEDFFRLVLVSKDREPFLKMLDAEEDDDDAIIDPKQLNMILEDLLTFYTGKALENDSSSTTQQPDAGAPLNVTSLTPRAATS